MSVARRALDGEVLPGQQDDDRVSDELASRDGRVAPPALIGRYP